MKKNKTRPGRIFVLENGWPPRFGVTWLKSAFRVRASFISRGDRVRLRAYVIPSSARLDVAVQTHSRLPSLETIHIVTAWFIQIPNPMHFFYSCLRNIARSPQFGLGAHESSGDGFPVRADPGPTAPHHFIATVPRDSHVNLTCLRRGRCESLCLTTSA